LDKEPPKEPPSTTTETPDQEPEPTNQAELLKKYPGLSARGVAVDLSRDPLAAIPASPVSDSTSDVRGAEGVAGVVDQVHSQEMATRGVDGFKYGVEITTPEVVDMRINSKYRDAYNSALALIKTSHADAEQVILHRARIWELIMIHKAEDQACQDVLVELLERENLSKRIYLSDLQSRLMERGRARSTVGSTPKARVKTGIATPKEPKAPKIDRKKQMKAIMWARDNDFSKEDVIKRQQKAGQCDEVCLSMISEVFDGGKK
jgi:hypothetical protein